MGNEQGKEVREQLVKNMLPAAAKRLDTCNTTVVPNPLNFQSRTKNLRHYGTCLILCKADLLIGTGWTRTYSSSF